MCEGGRAAVQELQGVFVGNIGSQQSVPLLTTEAGPEGMTKAGQGRI